MFTITSFEDNSNLVTKEALGDGREVYEVLLERGSQIAKVWINANKFDDMVRVLESRFSVKVDKIEPLLGSSLIKAKRLYSYSKKTNLRVFSDTVVRRVF